VPKSHNKKRNVGVVYELLLRRISECLINEDMQEAQKTLDIISRRFTKGSALYKEFRLFRALAKSEVSDSAIAAAILTEAKFAARNTDMAKLKKEKSSLIREMNYTLKDKNLYRRYIPDYKALATIQILLNDWRDGDNVDIQRMVMYESRVIQHLIEKKDNSTLEESIEPDIDSLVVKIMTEKINKKYKNTFSLDQRQLLNSYAFSSIDKSKKLSLSFSENLREIKSNSLEVLKKLEKTCDNKIILDKISDVRDRVISESMENINDNTVIRFLTLLDLCNEIKESLTCQDK